MSEKEILKENVFLKKTATQGFVDYAQIIKSLHNEEKINLQSKCGSLRRSFAKGLRLISMRPVADHAWALAPLFSACLASLTLIESEKEIPFQLLLKADEAEMLSKSNEMHLFLKDIK